MEGFQPPLHDHCDATTHRLTNANQKWAFQCRETGRRGTVLQAACYLPDKRIIGTGDDFHREIIHAVDTALADPEMIHGCKDEAAPSVKHRLAIAVIPVKMHIKIMLGIPSARCCENDDWPAGRQLPRQEQSSGDELRVTKVSSFGDIDFKGNFLQLFSL